MFSFTLPKNYPLAPGKKRKEKGKEKWIYYLQSMRRVGDRGTCWFNYANVVEPDGTAGKQGGIFKMRFLKINICVPYLYSTNTGTVIFHFSACLLSLRVVGSFLCHMFNVPLSPATPPGRHLTQFADLRCLKRGQPSWSRFSHDNLCLGYMGAGIKLKYSPCQWAVLFACTWVND